MSGQIIDASLISAPKQRNTTEERQALKEGCIPEEWKAKPAKLRHKDRDARWTVKFTKAKERAVGSRPPVDIAIPTFGYQNHVGIDVKHGLIRTWMVPSAATCEGAELCQGLLDAENTAQGVWADTAYRSAANEAFMAGHGFVSHVHRKKPKGRSMPERTRIANARKSVIRSRVEHVFAEQKARIGLFVRSIGLARATTRIGLVNLVFNVRHLIFLSRPASV
jgi:hypothetical protein